MKYIGQTGRPFTVRFHEHLRDFKYGNKKYKFAQHLLENRHPIDPMESIMETVHITSKGRMMDIFERYYIFRETKLNSQINDKIIIYLLKAQLNPICHLLLLLGAQLIFSALTR